MSFDPETGDRSAEYPVLEGNYSGDRFGLEPAVGERLLVVKEAGAIGRVDGRIDIILVQNWLEELQGSCLRRRRGHRPPSAEALWWNLRD